jgi:hypothetical protein
MWMKSGAAAFYGRHRDERRHWGYQHCSKAYIAGAGVEMAHSLNGCQTREQQRIFGMCCTLLAELHESSILASKNLCLASEFRCSAPRSAPKPGCNGQHGFNLDGRNGVWSVESRLLDHDLTRRVAGP